MEGVANHASLSCLSSGRADACADGTLDQAGVVVDVVLTVTVI